MRHRSISELWWCWLLCRVYWMDGVDGVYQYTILLNVHNTPMTRRFCMKTNAVQCGRQPQQQQQHHKIRLADLKLQYPNWTAKIYSFKPPHKHIRCRKHKGKNPNDNQNNGIVVCIFVWLTATTQTRIQRKGTKKKNWSNFAMCWMLSIGIGIGIWFGWARVQIVPIIFGACFEIAIDDLIEKIADENHPLLWQNQKIKYKYFANSNRCLPGHPISSFAHRSYLILFLILRFCCNFSSPIGIITFHFLKGRKTNLKVRKSESFSKLNPKKITTPSDWDVACKHFFTDEQKKNYFLMLWRKNLVWFDTVTAFFRVLLFLLVLMTTSGNSIEKGDEKKSSHQAQARRNTKQINLLYYYYYYFF